MLEFFDEVKRDKNKIISVLVIFAVLSFLDCAVVIKAQIKSNAAAGKKIVALKKDIDALSKELAVIQQNVKNTSEAAKKRSLKICSEVEIPMLLQEISARASANNIKVMQINTSKEVKPKDKSGFIPVAFNLDLEGGYHSLGSFLNSLEASQYPLFAEGMSIAAGAGAEDSLKLGAGLTLRTYVKK